MRRVLAKYVGKRVHVIGKVKRFGLSRSGTYVTLLLVNVIVNDKFMIDHVWIRTRKVFDIEIGDVVEFDAEVTPYKKIGTFFGVLAPVITDYSFKNIRNVKIVSKGRGKSLSRYIAQLI